MTWTWKKLVVPLSALPVLFLLAYGFRTDPRFVPSPLIEKAAPPFTLSLFDGGQISLDKLGGKVVVVNFWASWCFPACYEEAPLLEAAWRTYKDRGVVFVGVNVQDTEKAAREFMTRFQYSFANGPDPKGKISIDYGVYGIPETFIVDQRGRIAHKHIGAVNPQTFSLQIEELLGRESGAARDGGRKRDGA